MGYLKCKIICSKQNSVLEEKRRSLHCSHHTFLKMSVLKLLMLTMFDAGVKKVIYLTLLSSSHAEHGKNLMTQRDIFASLPYQFCLAPSAAFIPANAFIGL